mmetsp:Transcript_114029/g.197665  ORF Transcript_114029/g.197665 Transcript_114029/m.197665 type:complete len:219 (+) Transcript_114029:402-1058(+)
MSPRRWFLRLLAWIRSSSRAFLQTFATRSCSSNSALWIWMRSDALQCIHLKVLGTRRLNRRRGSRWRLPHQPLTMRQQEVAAVMAWRVSQLAMPRPMRRPLQAKQRRQRQHLPPQRQPCLWRARLRREHQQLLLRRQQLLLRLRHLSRQLHRPWAVRWKTPRLPVRSLRMCWTRCLLTSVQRCWKISEESVRWQREQLPHQLHQRTLETHRTWTMHPS